MSRGPGKWQRVIMERVKQGPFPLILLLPVPHTKAQSNAMHRAAHQLAEQGKLKYFWCIGAQRWGVKLPRQADPDQNEFRYDGSKEDGKGGYVDAADPRMADYYEWFRETKRVGGEASALAYEMRGGHTKRLSGVDCRRTTIRKQITSDVGDEREMRDVTPRG